MSSSEQRRLNRLVTVRFEDTAFADLQARADAHGMSKPAFIADLVAGSKQSGNGISPIQAAALQAELAMIRDEARAIGGNLNQLMRQLNTGRHMTTAADVQAVRSAYHDARRTLAVITETITGLDRKRVTQIDAEAAQPPDSAAS